jgi:hypothetical protein
MVGVIVADAVIGEIVMNPRSGRYLVNGKIRIS